eukprot:505933-Prymnesium_polylepis.1
MLAHQQDGPNHTKHRKKQNPPKACTHAPNVCSGAGGRAQTTTRAGWARARWGRTVKAAASTLRSQCLKRLRPSAEVRSREA